MEPHPEVWPSSQYVIGTGVFQVYKSGVTINLTGSCTHNKNLNPPPLNKYPERYHNHK